MRGEDNDRPILLAALHHAPHNAPNDHIHASGGFIEEQDGCIADHGIAKRDAASHATTVGRHWQVALLGELRFLQQGLDNPSQVAVCRRHALEHAPKVKVLLPAHGFKQHIVLRAQANHALDTDHVGPHIKTTHKRVAKCWCRAARQALDGGRLACVRKW